MISASTMPPSVPSAVIDSLAQVAWPGSSIRDYERPSGGSKTGPLMDDDERKLDYSKQNPEESVTTKKLCKNTFLSSEFH